MRAPILLLALLTALPLWAQQRCQLVRKGGHLLLSTPLDKLALERPKIESGFTTTMILRAAVVDQRDQGIVMASLRTIRMVYDLWEETFRIHIEGSQGEDGVRTGDRKEAWGLVRAVTNMDLGPVTPLLPGHTYRVRLLVEVNPVSAELLAETKRWLSRPQGSHRPFGSRGSTLFGSFASIFVNRRDAAAEHTLELLCPPFLPETVGR